MKQTIEVDVLDYSKITCPKCGLSHFIKKKFDEFTVFDSFALLNLRTEPEPEYLNGELQNPPALQKQKQYFKCKECSCNFKVEYYNSDDFTIINQDKEREEWKESLYVNTQTKYANSQTKKEENTSSAFVLSENVTSISKSLEYQIEELSKRVEALECKMNAQEI